MFPAPVDPMQALYQQFLTAPPENQRFPFLGAGTHDLALVNFRHYQSKDHGLAIAVDLMILKSTNPALTQNALACVNFMINKREKFESYQGREHARARTFTSKLLDEPDPEKTSRKICELLAGVDVQPARGAVVRCHAQDNPTKKKNDDGTPGTWTEYRWETIPGQSPQTVHEIRAMVDAVVGTVKPQPQQVQTQAPQIPVTQPQTQSYPPTQFQQPVQTPQPAPAPAPAPAGGVLAGLLGGR